MSLAGELEVLLNELDRGRASGGVARNASIRLADFLDANQDAILAALREQEKKERANKGPMADLYKAATETSRTEVKRIKAIRAMKEGKHV